MSLYKRTDSPRWWVKISHGGRTIVLVDGQMLIPERPGLGIDIDEEACARHPHRAYPLRHYIGTLTDIRPVSATPFFRIEKQPASA